jgi:hypothetical protein
MSQKNDYSGYVAFLPKSRAVVSVTESKNTPASKGKKKIEGVDYAPWGSDDKLPDRILQAVWENSFMPQLLETSTQFLHGQGLGVFRKRIVPGTDTRPGTVLLDPIDAATQAPDVQRWMELVDLQSYWLAACNQYPVSYNVFTGYQLNIEGKVVKMKVHDWAISRTALRDLRTGQIESILLFSEYIDDDGTKKKARVVPRYYAGIEKVKPDFIYHARNLTSGQSSYALPSWFGALETIEVLNRIPRFHASGIDNGYNVKYHVKVPAVYFDQFSTQEAKDKAWGELQDQMDEQLCGTDNVNKAVLTKFFLDPITNKPLPGFDIVPLQSVQVDEQYLKLHESFRSAAASGVGLHPGLANVDTGGKLGGTASEMRVAAQLHQELKTPIPRMLLLRPIQLAMKINGFDPSLVIAPKDFTLQTLDTNPTGSSKVVSNATT